MHGISTLATGMKTSIKVYFRKKVTEQYPENRKELKMFDRFRGTLNMPHNENNEHRCVACGLCQMACPNDTIKVTSETVETEDGKKKKILATYEYDLGACMFCQLCVNACPHDAITFDQNFEHAVFDRPLGFSFDVRDTFAVPDVSRNAEMLNASWQRSQYACNIDGLISVDPVFIQKMVEINGPVTLSNGTVLTGENTAEYMLNTIYKDVPVAQQDEYFEYIAKTVMDGAFGNMTVDKMMKVAQSIGDLAENRHFYAYTFHEDEAKYFQGAGLAKNAPESETNPETGIYISEQNPSKMGWYIDRSSEVTKTGDKTYHVKYTLTNRMTSAEMATCTSYILGGEQKGVGGVPVAPSGTSAQRVLIYAPAGGSIGSIAVTGDVRDRSNATMDGKPLNSSMAYIAPGKSVTYEFDVTVSDKATADMKLDQTPCGKMTNDVKYNY